MEKLAVDMDHREQWPLEYDEALTQFLCTKAETELAQDKVEEAESLLNDVLSFASRHPRVIAGQARVAVRKGKWQAAREQFKRALILSSDLGVKLAVSGVKQQAAVQGLIEEVCRERPLWLAEAGLEVQAWAEVALLGEEAVADTPEEPGAYFEMARKLVLVAERQLICQELGCLNNSPGEQVLDSEAFDRFDQAIAKAGQLSQSDEVNFWNVRGKAIFKPTAPNVRALMSAVEAGAHPASLMAVLRRIKNPTSALQYAREYPQDISVLVEIVLCQMELDALEAHQAAKRLVEATPGDPLYWSALSLAADKDNDPQGALEAIETALANWPDEPDWHARAAAYAVQAETYNKDVEHLSEAVALAPEKVEYGMALAKSFMTQNNPVQAINVLNRPEYISEDHPEVWLALAKAHQNAGQLEQALFSSEQAAVMDQQSSEPVLLCGKLALDLSRLETALDYARIAMQRAPRQADVVLFLAQVYSALNRLPEALDVLERAIPEVEQAAEVLVERARLVLKLKGPQASLELLKELVEQLPEHLDALSLLASTLVELGDLAAAEAVIHASLRIDPEQPAINLLMGKLQRQLGQLDQAIHYLSEAVRQAPDTVLGFLELAKTHLQRREDVQALNIYQQAIKVAPEDARAYYQAALILRETKDYLGAENMLRTAAKLAPDDLSIRRQLGAIIALNLVHNTQEATTNP
jgi:tetratricopeptide (TPR) repeat protein